MAELKSLSGDAYLELSHGYAAAGLAYGAARGPEAARGYGMPGTGSDLPAASAPESRPRRPRAAASRAGTRTTPSSGGGGGAGRGARRTDGGGPGSSGPCG